LICKGEKFRSITEHTFIDACLRGGGNGLAAIAGKFKVLSFSNPFLRMNFSTIERNSTDKRYVLWPKQK
jgi:hypothetical protein